MIVDEKNTQELAATTAVLDNLEAQTQPVEAVQATPEQPKEQPKPEGGHFRRLREEKEKAERERDELLRMMSQANQPRQQAPQEEEVHYNPDDLVEWKVVNNELSKMKNQMAHQQRQFQEQLVENRIKSQFNDFEKVANEENIAILKHEYPEVFETLRSSPDTYSKAASAYTLIKKLGIYKEDTYGIDKARAQQNAAKPKSASLIQPSIGSEALGAAAAYNGKMTKDLQKKLYEEMKEKSKSGYFR